MKKNLQKNTYKQLVEDITELYDHASYYTPFHEDWLKHWC